nr:MAG TPA: Endonuclease [Caudoviricetes sp.]
MGHYRGKKCTYLDLEFDSIPEKNYYIELLNNKDASNLQVHPKFILLEGFRNNEGKTIRSLTFKPDFMFNRLEDGKEQKYIVDIKPNNKKLIDSDFMIRWKLLQNMYKEQDILFRLIAWDSKKKMFVEI